MKKFEDIYIASDIDGTFLWECSYANPKNAEAVKYFTANGGHFAFSTGRNRFDTARVLPEWRELCNMPCIFCNGSMLCSSPSSRMDMRTYSYWYLFTLGLFYKDCISVCAFSYSYISLMGIYLYRW